MPATASAGKCRPSSSKKSGNGKRKTYIKESSLFKAVFQLYHPHRRCVTTNMADEVLIKVSNHEILYVTKISSLKIVLKGQVT
jgi:hypothetical protein